MSAPGPAPTRSGAAPLAAAATRAGRIELARAALRQGLGTDRPFRPLLGLLSALPSLRGAPPPPRPLARDPLIVLGNPRTGSTLLQRSLVELGLGVGPQLWQHLLAGSRRWHLARPLLPALRPLDPGRFHDPAVHETSLLHAETDEVALLAAEADGLFAFSFFWSFADDDWTALVDPAHRDTTARDLQLLGAHHAAVSAAAGGARVVARAFGLAPAMGALLRAWPTARVLLVLRDPAAFLPSARSLVVGTLQRRLGPRLHPALAARVGGRVEQGLIQLAAQTAAAWEALPADQRARVRIVPYPQLLHRFDAELEAIADFAGHRWSPAARAALRARAAAQATRTSPHRYAPAAAAAADPRLAGYRALLDNSLTGARNGLV